MTQVRRNLPAIRDAEMGAASFVPHLDLASVLRLIAAVAKVHPRTGERAGLLMALLFDTCLRVSEGINLLPRDLSRTNAGSWAAAAGKGNKTARVAVSSSLVANPRKIIRLPDQAAAETTLLSGLTGPGLSDYAGSL